jgi:hypothetical protein
MFFTARFAQDAKAAKGVFVGFVQILEERFRLWTEPSPDGRLRTLSGSPFKPPLRGVVVD